MTQKTKRHIFNFSHVSETDDVTYSGTFGCKKLSVRDYSQLAVIKARLNGGMHFDPTKPGAGVDENTDSFNHMLAHLELALVDVPTWWNLDEIGDIEVITKVFTEVAKFENSFRARGRDFDNSGEERSSSVDQKSNAGRAVGSLVGQEIPATLEP